jgi:hypothetical protein
MSKMSPNPRPEAESGAPIRILRRDPDDTCWLATREGEPSFQGVSDLGDAINASSTRGDVAILVSERVYEHMCSYSDAWYPVPSRVRVD